MKNNQKSISSNVSGSTDSSTPGSTVSSSKGSTSRRMRRKVFKRAFQHNEIRSQMRWTHEEIVKLRRKVFRMRILKWLSEGNFTRLIPYLQKYLPGRSPMAVRLKIRELTEDYPEKFL